MSYFASQWDVNLDNMVIPTGTKQHLHGHVEVSFKHVTQRPIYNPALGLYVDITSEASLSRSNESPYNSNAELQTAQTGVSR